MKIKHNKKNVLLSPSQEELAEILPDHFLNLVIVGAGAGEVLGDIVSLIRDYPQYKIVGIVDPHLKLRGEFFMDIPVLGWLAEIPHHTENIVIGVPYIKNGFDREAVFRLLIKNGKRLPALTAFDAKYNSSIILKTGTLLLAGAQIKEGAFVEENCLIGKNAVVEAGVKVSAHSVVPAESVVTKQNVEPALVPLSLEATLVKDNEPIQEIIQRMNKAAAEILLVVNSNGMLVGTITDGDIRRGILAGVDMAEPASVIMNPSPITVPQGTSNETMLKIMRSRSIRHLPVLDSYRKPIRIERMEDLLDDLTKGNAIIMAGGLGSRLRPLTEHTPKPLIKVAGKPILDHILTGLKQSGIQDVVLSLNYLGDRIREYMDGGEKHHLNINYVSEKERLGTAGALSLIKPAPSKPFLVMNGDLLTNLNFVKLLDFQKQYGYQLVMCVKRYTVPIPYGVVEIEKGKVKRLKEKPDINQFINAGIYVLAPICLKLIPAGKYFDMTDLITKAITAGFSVGAFPIYEYWRDIGRPEDLKTASEEQAKLAVKGDIR
jgi:NDP-sugar pyrophosphorylase family protein/predicted transcriptional regulator